VLDWWWRFSGWFELQISNGLQINILLIPFGFLISIVGFDFAHSQCGGWGERKREECSIDEVITFRTNTGGALKSVKYCISYLTITN
jgi:hypothetical protein